MTVITAMTVMTVMREIIAMPMMTVMTVTKHLQSSQSWRKCAKLGFTVPTGTSLAQIKPSLPSLSQPPRPYPITVSPLSCHYPSSTITLLTLPSLGHICRCHYPSLTIPSLLPPSLSPPPCCQPAPCSLQHGRPHTAPRRAG